jgi:antirestriction protein ArdC
MATTDHTAGQASSKPRATYDRLLAGFIQQLEAGTAPWVRPWSEGRHSPSMPRNAATGRHYQGVNVLLLWGAAQAFGYPANGWLTYHQAKEAGGNVRRGERGQVVVFFKTLTRVETDAEGEEHERSIMLLRGFTVFNVAQCEGLTHQEVKGQPGPECEDEADRFIMATGADLRRGGNRACYVPSEDFIRLPERKQFNSRQHDQATALHELAHWTGHDRRLDRAFGRRFGDNAYAAEELVAELTAAFLCADLGITGELQHAEYLSSWASALKAKPNMLWTAASKASEAATYLKATSAAVGGSPC